MAVWMFNLLVGCAVSDDDCCIRCFSYGNGKNSCLKLFIATSMAFITVSHTYNDFSMAISWRIFCRIEQTRKTYHDGGK